MATTLVINILANAADAKKAIGEVSKSVEGLGNESSNMGKIVAAGAATAITALVGLGVSALNAAQESAKVGRETERVLRTTGSAAWESVSGVQALSKALSEKSGVDDEAIQSGANLLLTFTQVQNQVGKGNDIFDRATAAALDMSTALGSDMSSAAIQLGKALNDPIKGMTALSRAGVSFTQSQKDQVAALVASGDALSAQKIILNEVEKEFKGAAEAAATPFDKLKVAIQNLEEDIGAHLIPPVTAFVNLLLTGLGPGLANVSAFLEENAGALKLVASAAAAAVIIGYEPLVTAQLAVIGTGILDFIFRLNVAFEAMAGATSISAAATELWRVGLVGLSGTIATTIPPMLVLTGAIFAIQSVLDTSSESADRFLETVKKGVQPGSFKDMNRVVLETEQRMTSLRTEITKQQGDWRNTGAAVLDVLIPIHDVNGSLIDMQDELSTLNKSNDAYKAKLNESEQALLTYAESHVAATHSMDDSDKTALRLSQSYAGIIPEIKGVNSELQAIAASKKIELTEPGAVDRVEALWERSKVLGSATLEMTDAQKKFNDAAGDAKDKVDAYKSSLDALIGVHLSAAEAQTNLSQNSFKLAKTLAENQKVVTSTTEEGTLARLAQTAAIDENNKAVQDNVKQILDMANATFKESQQTEGSTVALGKANEVLVTQRDKLIATMVQFGYSEEAAKAYVDRLGLTPKNIDTQVRLDNGAAMAALDDTRRKALETAGTYTAVMDINTAPAHKKLDDLLFAFRIAANEMRDRAFLGTGQSPPGRAAGGPVTAGQAFIVGERGPELFVPVRSGSIVPNSALSRAPGATTVINVNVAHTGLGVDSPRLQRDVVEALRRYEKRNGRGTA